MGAALGCKGYFNVKEAIGMIRSTAFITRRELTPTGGEIYYEP
ncbi:hypothetical protein ACFO1S_15475 [Cohnella boryungensis]|uniref:Uncharacterized protein n=1 Tax=Cohnella boryungensis TaxID=768479 RepID=A0ABV8SCS9_9BACL